MHDAQIVLKRYFGYDKFRPIQEKVIETILSKKDCLVLMPTGGGKSICFQVPSMMFDGLTLVISPLISLMKDQVESLKANGIEAAFINSSLEFQESIEIMNKCRNRQIKLLYVSPEKLLSDFEYLAKLNIDLIAVDEAHCISQWGHDFRPEYTKLQIIKDRLPYTPIIALTATADKVTRKDICDQLNLENPEVFIASFDRPNLSLKIRKGLGEKGKNEEILNYIETRKEESGIIYCLSRTGCEKVASYLKSQGINADYYHAGISNQERSRVQEDFINDKINVICATVAFGMGIDKSNVRWVIHYNLPKSMEGYYQEIGRAGRDGLNSDTVLYFNNGDLNILTKFAESGGQAEMNVEKLNRMQQYAEATICRRKILLSYFGEVLENDCGNCDICRNPRPRFDGTTLAQKAVSALIRAKEDIKPDNLIEILRGTRSELIIARGYEELKTFGAGRDIAFPEWQSYVQQFIQLGLIEIAYDQGFTLKVTSFGLQVVKGEKMIQLVKPIKIVIPPAEIRKVAVSSSVVHDKYSQDQLFEELKKLRRRLAAEENMPAYIVFSDATLKEMAKEQPDNELDFLAINGVGQKKYEQFGYDFINLIRNFKIDSKSVKKAKTDTYNETLDLYKAGLSPDEIALRRGVSPITIYSHIAQLYQQGENINLLNFVTKKEIERVKEAQKELNGTEKMKDIYVFLNEEIDYFKIRLALAYNA